MKQAFLLKNNWGEIFDSLSDKQAGVLIKALFRYNVEGEKPAGLTDLEVKAYFNMMLLDCNAMKSNYDRRCETSAQNGSFGGRPKNLKKPNNLSKPGNDNETDNGNETGINSPHVPPTIRFAEFVNMTNAEYEALALKTGSTENAGRCIEILDNYKGSSGKKYKSDYRAILNWVIDRMNEQKTVKTNGNKQTTRNSPGSTHRPTAGELNAAVEIGLSLAAAAKNK